MLLLFKGSGSKVQRLGLRPSGYDPTRRVQGLGFRVLGSEVQGSWFKVLDYFGFNLGL